ncbi:MAG: Rrf2 family transcriptional regulator [Phycisphaeraceae bacterium]|nr:Rrf2 family transcriptional regulator [Phycisphaeraceae bacterium]
MKLSKTSAHAALALAFLADQPAGVVIQARHIATHLGIPTDSALKILQVLARQEIIISQLGRTGGYRLHRQPQEISLAQIVEAIDGPINGSMRLDSREAIAASVNLLQSVCDQAASRLREELSRTTVADLVRCKQPNSVAQSA